MIAFLRLAVLAASVCVFAPAEAATIVVSSSGPLGLKVDGSRRSTLASVGQSGIITNVNITLDVSGCGGDVERNGTCPPIGGVAANDQLFLTLRSPSGTVVRLVQAGDLIGGAPSGRGAMTFDDSASATLFGLPVQTGFFLPSQALSAFNGEDAAGDWRIQIGDTTAQSKHQLNAYSLSIKLSEVPLPPAMGLMLPALGALVALRRRKA